MHPDQLRFITDMQGWFSICRVVCVTHRINKMKDKNYRIISIDAEKALNKIQYSFIIKNLKMGLEGTYSNIIKATYDKSNS